MRVGGHLLATRTLAARFEIGVGMAIAQEAPGEFTGETQLADSRSSDESIGMRQPAGRTTAAELFNFSRMTQNCVPCHTVRIQDLGHRCTRGGEMTNDEIPNV